MDKTSPSLEVISSPPEIGPVPSERRRLPRLSLSAEQFRLAQNGKLFAVTDLSTTGMGLRILDQEDFLLFPVATYLEGILKLGDEKQAVSARVRHLGTETVGCEFEGLTPGVSAVLESFLDPRRLGAELKPLPASEEGASIWYHGPSGTDLLLKRSADGQFQRMTLYVLGSYVQWTQEDGLSTGRARPSDEHSEKRGFLRFETLLLDADPQVDGGKLEVAKTVILSSNLAEDFKKWCGRKLEGPV